MKEFKTLFKWIGKNIVPFSIVIILLVILAYTRSIVPQFISYTIDSILQGKQSAFPAIFDHIVQKGTTTKQKTIYLIILLIAFQTVRAALMVLRNYISSISNENIMRDLRKNVYQQLQKLPYSYYKMNNAGDIIQRCTTDMDVVRTFISSELVQFTWIISIIVATIYAMFSINVVFSIISLVTVPIIFYFSMYYNRLILTIFEKIDHDEGKMTNVVKENISGVEVVKAFGSQKFEHEKYIDKCNIYFSKLLVFFKMISKFQSITTFFIAMQSFIIITVGIYFIKNGSITIGTLILFLSYIKLLSIPIKSLGQLLSRLGRNFVAIRRINAILESSVETVESIEMPINGDIEFKNVSFKYEDGENYILDNISFSIKSGEKVAIIGRTGSGKSTISHLMLRLFEPSSGEIFINNQDISLVNKNYLRENIGLVVQEPYLFSKDVGENIGIKSSSHSFDEITHYARIAHIHDDIEGFEQGYYTEVGEKGTTLSGGQKQRLAIARMLINKYNVLIFDDSLSAVDNETDRSIRKSLDYGSDVTIITITHRISSILDCDKIIVLENGKVTEMGSISDLLALNGYFNKLYKMQVGETYE